MTVTGGRWQSDDDAWLLIMQTGSKKKKKKKSEFVSWHYTPMWEKKKTCQTCSHISPTTVISAVNDPEIQQSSPSYRSTDARQNSKWLSGYDEEQCRPKLGARRLHIGEGQRVGNWAEKKEAWAYTSLNANTSALPDLKRWVSPVCGMVHL